MEKHKVLVSAKRFKNISIVPSSVVKARLERKDFYRTVLVNCLPIPDRVQNKTKIPKDYTRSSLHLMGLSVVYVN